MGGEGEPGRAFGLACLSLVGNVFELLRQGCPLLGGALGARLRDSGLCLLRELGDLLLSGARRSFAACQLLLNGRKVLAGALRIWVISAKPLLADR